mgnify:CR=1 FL=1
MDHIDREILQILQHNARASLKMIAEKTFLSSPAVSARIEKLEKDGIITSYQAQIDPMKLGYHILAFINLNVLPEDKQKFYNYAEHLRVQQRYRRILRDHEGCLREHNAARWLPRPAPEVRQDQYPGGIRHPCRSTRRAGTGIGIHTKNKKDI